MDFVNKVVSLLFNMLSRLVIMFLPRSKHLLVSWLQSPSAEILKPQKIKSLTVSIVSRSICREMMGLDAMILVFWMVWALSQLFHSPLSLSSVQFNSVTLSCPTLCDPMNRSTQASLFRTNTQSLPKPTSIESVMPSSHLILSSPSPPASNPSQH